jgi:hypothetical protein
MEQTRQYLERIASQYVINPLVIINGGLRAGDRVTVEKKPGAVGPKLDGMNLYATRGQERLLWQPQGFGRSNSGRDILLPYITSWKAGASLVELIGESTGYAVVPYSEDAVRRTYTLEEPTVEVRRLIDEDLFSFAGSQVQVVRAQPMIDMNLQRPDQSGLIVYTTHVHYCSQLHHLTAVARILTEANGLKCVHKCCGSYQAVK